MKKKFFISLISLIFLAVAYVGFWFFKAHEQEKYIKEFVLSVKRNYVSAPGASPEDNSTVSTSDASIEIQNAVENSKEISIGNIEVAGFPLAHQINIKDLRWEDSKTGSASIQNIVMESGVFASDFHVKSMDPIVIEDKNDKIVAIVELNADTKISGKTASSKISELKYSGSGATIRDDKKYIKYIADYKNLQILLLNDKTMQFKASDDGYKLLDDKNKIIFAYESSLINIISSTEGKTIITKIDAKINNFEYPEIITVQNDDSSANKGKNTFSISAVVNATENEDTKTIDLLPANQMANLPPEYRSHYQKKPAPYFWDVDLQNLELRNSSYSISYIGKFATFADDQIPSGFVTIKIENLDNLLITIVDSIKKMANSAKEMSLSTKVDETTEPVNNTDLAKINSTENNARVENSLAAMALQFLDQLGSTLKEVAIKNPVTTEKLSVFEITRKRKGDTFINGVTPMEILARLMPQEKANDEQLQNSTNSSIQKNIRFNQIGVQENNRIKYKNPANK